MCGAGSELAVCLFLGKLPTFVGILVTQFPVFPDLYIEENLAKVIDRGSSGCYSTDSASQEAASEKDTAPFSSLRPNRPVRSF